MIVALPIDVGAVQATVTDVGLTSVAVPIVGVSGTVVAVIELDAGPENGETPFAFVAVAVKVYDVLDAKLVAVTGDAPVNVAGDVAGFGVTL